MYGLLLFYASYATETHGRGRVGWVHMARGGKSLVGPLDLFMSISFPEDYFSYSLSIYYIDKLQLVL